MSLRTRLAGSFSSRVALRVFLLCALCSLLPTVIIGVTVYTRIAEAETEASNTRLRELAKRYGLLLHERMILVEESLLEMANEELGAGTLGGTAIPGDRVRDVRLRRLDAATLAPADNRNHPNQELRLHGESMRGRGHRRPAGHCA